MTTFEGSDNDASAASVNSLTLLPGKTGKPPPPNCTSMMLIIKFTLEAIFNVIDISETFLD
jgi:hypothetical protein